MITESEAVTRPADPPFLNHIFDLLAVFLDETADGSWPCNRWLRAMPDMEVYVRRTPRSLPEGDFVMLDLANVTVTHKHQGTWTRFLDRLEAMQPLQGIYLENVSDPRLIRYYQRRGYHLRPNAAPIFSSFSLYRVWRS